MLEKKEVNDDVLQDKSAIMLRIARSETQLGNFETALTYIKKAKKITVTLHGQQSQEYAKCLTALAIVREKMDEDEIAISLMTEARDIILDLSDDEDSVEVNKAQSNLEGLSRHVGVKRSARESNIEMEDLYKMEL